MPRFIATSCLLASRKVTSPIKRGWTKPSKNKYKKKLRSLYRQYEGENRGRSQAQQGSGLDIEFRKKI